jgi:hypothetical protein
MSWLDKLLGRAKKPAADAPRDAPPPPDMPATPPPPPPEGTAGSDTGSQSES